MKALVPGQRTLESNVLATSRANSCRLSSVAKKMHISPDSMPVIPADPTAYGADPYPNKARSPTLLQLALIVATTCLCAATAAAQIMQMSSRDAPRSASRSPYMADVQTYSALPTMRRIVLEAPSATELAREKLRRRAIDVAFGRAVVEANEIDVPSGVSRIRFSVTSPTARALRVGLTLTDRTQYRIAAWAPGDSRAVLLTTSNNQAQGRVTWTGVTSGPTQFIAIERTVGDGRAWSVKVSQVSHFTVPALSNKLASAGYPYGLNMSAPCQVDLVCELAPLTAPQQQTVLDASRGVALLFLTYTDGTSASCTGTLLNSASYPIALLLTANHCVAGDLGDKTLSGLATVWFFSRAVCGSSQLGDFVQLDDSGTILWHDLSTDGALLKIDELPPYPASYAGWNASLQLLPGTFAFGIHHPRADVKKGSLATILGPNPAPVTFGAITYPPGTFFEVGWDVGIVEPGSSGSGLFALDSTGMVLQLRATLTGGNNVCYAPQNVAYYSQLANMYPAIGALLTQPLPGTTGPSLDQRGLTGSWYNPETSGQGFELEIFPDLVGSGTALVAGAWFTYDVAPAGGSDHQRWYTFSGNGRSGAPNVPFTIYQNVGGNFGAPPITDSVAVGSGTLSFSDCTDGAFNYAFFDGSGRSGSIPITRITPNVTCAMSGVAPANADFGFSGNWYNPALSGQGFVVEMNPLAPVLFFTWYTYAEGGATVGAAGQRWYTGQAAYVPGARTIATTLYETTGGIFDTATVPGPTTSAVGTATVTFTSCSTAQIQFNFTAGSNAGASGVIGLTRVGPTPPECAM